MRLLPIFAATVGAALTASATDNWPQFRGPNASGISDSAKPPAVFAPGTNRIWKIPVPSGASSPCVWGDLIFLTAFEDGKLETLCYQRKDGKLLWKADAKAEKIEDYNIAEGSPAASTPATDGERVVSYFGSCGLICYDTKGKELWRYSLPTAESPGGFGTGGSPIIEDGLVVVGRDQSTACSLLAVDLKTGKKVWETARPDVGPGFGTPIFWKNDGAKEIVMPGSFKLKGYDLKTGEERWSLAGMPSFTCTTPVVGPDMLYFAGWSPGKEPGTGPSWDGMVKPADKDNDNVVTLEEAKAAHFDAFFKPLDVNGDGKLTPDDLAAMQAQMARGENVLVAIKPGGKGELAESGVAWKQTRGLPYVPSPLLYKDRIYIVKDGGMLSSFDAATGKVYYQQERLDAVGNYYTSPVAADGRIYVASLNGRVTVLEAGGDTPKILHQADFGERISATPALVGDAIYYRTATALYAFGK
ncbi:MAG TPA: PQQ-binding-like beta-propeller repeat protein [Verrucomicrobiota bacterium]|nr:PQQ-binding-like beta-propeller repeat protein [Verrucomicrobiota bacterium]